MDKTVRNQIPKCQEAAYPLLAGLELHLHTGTTPYLPCQFHQHIKTIWLSSVLQIQPRTHTIFKGEKQGEGSESLIIFIQEKLDPT